MQAGPSTLPASASWTSPTSSSTRPTRTSRIEGERNAVATRIHSKRPIRVLAPASLSTGKMANEHVGTSVSGSAGTPTPTASVIRQSRSESNVVRKDNVLSIPAATRDESNQDEMDLDSRMIYQHTSEVGKGHKSRKSWGGSLASGAFTAGVYGAALGLTAYRLWSSPKSPLPPNVTEHNAGEAGEGEGEGEGEEHPPPPAYEESQQAHSRSRRSKDTSVIDSTSTSSIQVASSIAIISNPPRNSADNAVAILNRSTPERANANASRRKPCSTSTATSPAMEALRAAAGSAAVGVVVPGSPSPSPSRIAGPSSRGKSSVKNMERRGVRANRGMDGACESDGCNENEDEDDAESNHVILTPDTSRTPSIHLGAKRHQHPLLHNTPGRSFGRRYRKRLVHMSSVGSAFGGSGNGSLSGGSRFGTASTTTTSNTSTNIASDALGMKSISAGSRGKGKRTGPGQRERKSLRGAFEQERDTSQMSKSTYDPVGHDDDDRDSSEIGDEIADGSEVQDDEHEKVLERLDLMGVKLQMLIMEGQQALMLKPKDAWRGGGAGGEGGDSSFGGEEYRSGYRGRSGMGVRGSRMGRVCISEDQVDDSSWAVSRRLRIDGQGEGRGCSELDKLKSRRSLPVVGVTI